jgi:hypothetical protein
MNDSLIIYEEQGCPTIKLFEDRISIKAVDYSTFQDFKLGDIKFIELYRPYENSFLGLLFRAHPFSRKYRERDDYVLRIKLKDGEHWDYNTVYNFSDAFKNLIENVQSKLCR